MSPPPGRQYQLGQALQPFRRVSPAESGNSDRVSFDWEAMPWEAQRTGPSARTTVQLQRRPSPLPVSLHVRDMTFADALRLNRRPRLPGGQSSRSQPGVYICLICQRRRKMKNRSVPAVRVLLLAGCAGQHHPFPCRYGRQKPPPDIRAWLTPTGQPG